MRRLLAATAIASLVLLTAGCGDDDKSPVATSSAEDDAADSSDSGPGAGDSDDESADDSGSNTTDESDDDGTAGTIPGIPNLSDDCKAASLAFATMMSGGSLGDIDSAIEQMKANAPDEIADEIVMLAEIYGPIAEAIKAKGGDVSTAFSDPEIIAMMQELSTPEMAAATERVSTYFQENCAIGS